MTNQVTDSLGQQYELRRKIAEKRCWTNLELFDAWEIDGGVQPLDTSGKDAEWFGKPPGSRLNDKVYVPAWDCDLNTAGDLWVEMIAAGLTVSIDEDGFCLSTIISPGIQVHIEVEEVADPKERLCVAICRLWLAWKEGA